MSYRAPYPLLLWFILAACACVTVSSVSGAAGPDDEAERVSVDSIKEKYWARGDEAELGVVQNRIYSKKMKLEAGFFGGVISTDPFLSVKSLGGSIGFHFSEYLALSFVGWRAFSRPSSALETFQQTIGATTNNNPPSGFAGGEVAASLLYGKLSVLGKKIIYYDFHALGGLGMTFTESGSYFTPLLGLGQKIYITKSASIRIDYRLLRFNERIIEKVITPRLGQLVGERVNFGNSVTLGVTILFGLGSGGEGASP